MTVQYHRVFKSHYKKRIKTVPSLNARYAQRIRLFIKDSTAKTLKDHALSGSLKGYRSFSITGDIRVVYQRKNNIFLFYDIGTHNQVYR